MTSGWKRRASCIYALCSGLLLIAGAVVTEAASAEVPACIKPGSWMRLQENHPVVSNDALLREVSQRRVVLLGERHDNADHHAWQLQVLAGLYALHPDMVIGFEMFPRSVQPVLDRWVAGELTEQEFLKQTEWQTNWSFDPNLYLPLFTFARITRIPMHALNAARALVNTVRSKGWAATPESERGGITDPAPADRDYLKLLAGSFLAHRPGGRGETRTSAARGRDHGHRPHRLSLRRAAAIEGAGRAPGFGAHSVGRPDRLRRFTARFCRCDLRPRVTHGRSRRGTPAARRVSRAIGGRRESGQGGRALGRRGHRPQGGRLHRRARRRRGPQRRRGHQQGARHGLRYLAAAHRAARGGTYCADREVSAEAVSRHGPPAVMRLRSRPIFSTSHSTTSPGRRNSGGVRANPTPAGVPVAMMSPGSSIMPRDSTAMVSAIEKIWCRVFDDCSNTPLTQQRRSSRCGSAISPAVTIHGPIGHAPSRLLPRKYCLWRNWRSRAERSLSTV